MAEATWEDTRQRRVQRAAALSVASNSVLVVGKLVTGLIIGSVAVVSEAIHSAVDLLAALIAWFAVREAGKPADEQHAYGHGKIENLAALIEAALIVAAAIWIIIEAALRLVDPKPVAGASWGVLAMGISALVNLLVSSYLMAVGRRCDSIALQADAWHLRTDVLTSFGVMAALAVIWAGDRWWGVDLWWVDPVVAIAVALLILRAGAQLTSEAGGDLIDRSLPMPERSWIIAHIRALYPRITGFHDLRTRKAGRHRFVEVHLVVPEDLNIRAAHALAESVELGIGEHFPGTTVTVHLDPCDLHCPPRCLAGCLLGEERNRRRAERGLPPIDPPAR
ncbi:MAG: cation diffusion facilitator family transporter [Planctomycetota bacterium]|nr:cation diffusion facilitator family transporter [Planctomycetota bacterium]